jgi:hypothetical protein
MLRRRIGLVLEELAELVASGQLDNGGAARVPDISELLTNYDDDDQVPITKVRG